MASKLNPPILASKLPAFYGNQLIVPFALNRAVGFNQFNAIKAIVKTVSTNTKQAELIAGYDRETGKDYGRIWYDTASRSYRVLFELQSNEGLNYFKPVIGQYYKIQIAFINAAPVTESPIGYYSSAGVIKYSAEPTIYIEGLKEQGNLEQEQINKNIYEYTGVYLQEHDQSEKIYSYRFDLYDDTNALVATTGQLIHNNSMDIDIDSSNDTWRLRKNLTVNKPYYIQYKVITINGLGEIVPCESPKYQIMEMEISKPDIGAKLSAQPNEVEGYIQLSLIGTDDLLEQLYKRSGSFLLLRSSSIDNFDSWEQLTEFELSLYNPRENKDLYKDYTVEQGREYIYAIQAYNPQGYMSGRLLNTEGKVHCEFEDAFLFDGERQLKIRFNPSVSTFKSTILESKMDTIGNKYPFIFRNGIVNYKEFSISGLLSLLGDENLEFFKELKDTKINEELFQLTGDNYYNERQFKLKALEWLSDGKPKLFKSPAEGNYIVRLLDVSLSPEDALGRMLHTFNCTAYEIGPFDFDGLNKFNLIAGYTEDNLYYHTIDLNSSQNQAFWPDGGGHYDNSIIVTPQSYSAKIIGNPGTEFYYYLSNVQTPYSDTISSNGIYEFSESLLNQYPLMRIELASKNKTWGNGAVLQIGYKDPRIKVYSYIYDVSAIKNRIELPKDFDDSNYEEAPETEIILPPFWDGKVETKPETPEEDKPIIENPDSEIIEKPNWQHKCWMKDILKFLEDLRNKTGMFYYINIFKRPQIQLFKENGNTCFWKNNKKFTFNGNDFSIFDFNDLYISEDGTSYFDGWDLCNKMQWLSKPQYEITNKFALNDILFNMEKTQNNTQTFVDLTSLNNFRIGNGLGLEVIYQNKEITYSDEKKGEDDPKVIEAKNLWKQAIENNLSNEEITKYYNDYIEALRLAGGNIDLVKAKDAWQQAVNKNLDDKTVSELYNKYLSILQRTLDNTKTNTKVGMDNVIYAI